ncbi:MAG TPA: hypothetical protein VNZ53_44295 [Steroidobacteraceae bacterium]|jgi:hypothetical protein|nr:hypothetical protein [Steroidobacteraceae bacterium]
MRYTFALSLLMLFSLPVLCDESAATIRFLSHAEARAALTTGAERGYYARLQLPEMRAKTGLALENVTLEAAREQVRETYGARVEDFSADEQAALREVVTGLQTLLRTRAPLYARTPWVFIKVESTIEGGLPHTRGDCIVLSDALLARIVQMHAKSASSAPLSLWNLLVHEQTHVLQRRHPELFVNLYTQSLGFHHVVFAPPPQWLIERNVLNPDAPDADWIFPVGDAAARHWILPEVLLLKLEHPRMPDDFDVVAIDVRERDGAWGFADRSMPASLQELSALPDFLRAFPVHEEMFHPNEISAGLLAAIITGSGIEHPEHPLWNKTRAWADQALR